jgi:hypothetical protein
VGQAGVILADSIARLDGLAALHAWMFLHGDVCSATSTAKLLDRVVIDLRRVAHDLEAVA